MTMAFGFFIPGLWTAKARFLLYPPEQVLEILCEEQPLPQKYHDHALNGNFIGHRECHITPDWLLIYKIEAVELLLSLTRTGTHSDLF